MNALHLFVLVMLLHFFADFNLQIGATLHQMKQRSWWVDQCSKLKLGFTPYRNDWIVALLIHSMVWSMLSYLPLVLNTQNGWLISGIVVGNTIVHAVIDHLKANRRCINLVVDQILHLVQISITIGLWWMYK